MANIERLTKTSQLSIKRLEEFKKGKPYQPNLWYDEELDTLMILLVDPMTETTVHYADDHVALLYEPDTNEVVGVQIEGFKKSFIGKHVEVANVWRLKDCRDENEIRDFGDLVICFEAHKPEVAREVIKVTEDMVFGNRGSRARLPQMA